MKTNRKRDLKTDNKTLSRLEWRMLRDKIKSGHTDVDEMTLTPYRLNKRENFYD